MGLIANFSNRMVDQINREINHHRVKAMDSMGFITYNCTSRCKTCTIWRREWKGGQELSAEQWMLAIDRLADYGIRTFEIFGGDALMRKDVVFKLMRRCQQRGIETYFPTNANLCDRETIETLIEAGLGTVYLSIDDVEEQHDDVRGVEGTFGRVKKALEDFCEIRGDRSEPQIVICVTLSRMNFRRFPNLLKFLEKYPIDAVYPRPLGEFSQSNIEASTIDNLVPESYFAPSDGQSHLMNEDELSEMRQIISQLKEKSSKLYINWQSYYVTTDDTFLKGTYPYYPCHLATRFVTLNPNGDVIPCPFFRQYVIGNLIETPLEEIWGNKQHRRFINLQQKKQLPICSNCNMRVYYPSLKETLNYYMMRSLECTGLIKN